MTLLQIQMPTQMIPASTTSMMIWMQTPSMMSPAQTQPPPASRPPSAHGLPATNPLIAPTQAGRPTTPPSSHHGTTPAFFRMYLILPIHPSIHPSIYIFTNPPTHHRPSCFEPTAQNFVDPQCTCLCFFEDTPLVDPRCKGWFGDLLQAVATPAASGDPGTVTASSVAAIPPPPAAPSGSGVPGS